MEKKKKKFFSKIFHVAIAVPLRFSGRPLAQQQCAVHNVIGPGLHTHRKKRRYTDTCFKSYLTVKTKGPNSVWD